MRRFKNMLAVYRDAIGDDDALTQATVLTDHNAAQLTLVEVLNVAEYSVAKRAEREKHLNRLAASISNGAMPVKASVRFGTPFIEIIQQVHQGNHDLVVTSAKARARIQRAFLWQYLHAPDAKMPVSAVGHQTRPERSV